MWARFTVLSDTPIASAIVGCVIPLSRSNTIWMRWRCSGCPFQPSAVFKRRICFLVHLTICLSESDQMVRENHTPTLECNSLRHSVPQYRSTSIQSALETVLHEYFVKDRAQNLTPMRRRGLQPSGILTSDAATWVNSPS